MDQKEVKEKIVKLYQDRSPRERNILLLAFVTAFLLVAYWLPFEVIAPKFEEQSARLKKVQSDFERFPSLLGKYKKLNAQLKSMEEKFAASDDSAGSFAVLSYLETLTKKSKADFQTKPRIDRRGVPTPLGDKFEQEAYSMRMTTANLDGIVKIIETIIKEKPSLIITSIELKRGRSAIDATIDLSNIQKKT